MSVLVSLFAIAVSAVTVAQAARALSSGTRLRDRIAKDIAIHKELPTGPIRDELAANIREATILLLVTERYRPNWYAVPLVMALNGVSASLLVWNWIDFGTPSTPVLVSAGLAYVGAGLIVVGERGRLERVRKPMIDRLRSDTPRRDDAQV